MDVIMNIYCFGGKVNEFQHSDKGTGVEKLQYSKMPDKTLTNRYIKAYREQKRWWQVWKSSFFLRFFSQIAQISRFFLLPDAKVSLFTPRAERLISVRSVISVRE